MCLGITIRLTFPLRGRGTAKRWMRCVLSIDCIADVIRCADYSLTRMPLISHGIAVTASPRRGGSLTVNVYLRKNENM